MILKIITTVLPLFAVRRLTRPAWGRYPRVLAWVEAALFPTYGFVYTTFGPLVQAGIIHPSGTVNHQRHQDQDCGAEPHGTLCDYSVDPPREIFSTTSIIISREGSLAKGS